MYSKLGLKNQDEWRDYLEKGKRPFNIPANPSRTYSRQWKGIADWLGYEESTWSVRKVKELLHALIESKIIYRWDEAVLYSLLGREGVLNLGENRHKQFFRNLIEASRTNEGYKAIEEYANSDSEIPPDLSKLTSLHQEDSEQEIQKASSQEANSSSRKYRAIRLWRNPDR